MFFFMSAELLEKIFVQQQGIFWLSLGAEFRLHSQSKIATFFPIPFLFFPIKKNKKNIYIYIFTSFLDTTTTYEKQWPISEWYLNTCV